MFAKFHTIDFWVLFFFVFLSSLPHVKHAGNLSIWSRVLVLGTGSMMKWSQPSILEETSCTWPPLRHLGSNDLVKSNHQVHPRWVISDIFVECKKNQQNKIKTHSRVPENVRIIHFVPVRENTEIFQKWICATVIRVIGKKPKLRKWNIP